jgi:dephospho-CoA kinase
MSRGRLLHEQGELPTEKRTGHRKPVIGLAGGIGSGKSTAASMLGELGAGVIRSDDLAAQEIDAPEVKKALCDWWGAEVLRPDGSVDRQKVASIAFGDPAQRRRLEALLHPRVAVRRDGLIAEFERQGSIKAIVLDSPLLYEVDLDLACDGVIFVEADDETRRMRSEKARGWSPGEWARREKSQQPLDMKRSRADYTCDNNSTLAALRQQVERVFAEIVSQAGAWETHTVREAQPPADRE